MNNPFAQAAKSQDTGVARRRSTRIDFVTTVLLSGKDATGTPFREYTQTSIVNLHGCKVRTSYRIVVGMLVTVECPKAGTSGKGVCVRVWESSPGIVGHEIAVQLIKPQNLWGVTNPPADWEVVAKSMVQGKLPQGERSVIPPAAPSGTPTPLPRPGVATAVIPAQNIPTPKPMPAPSPVAAPVAAPGLTTEQRLAELERRATQLVDSVLDIMRGQAEELTRTSLDEFRQQIDALIQDSEGRIRQSLAQAYEESATSLISLRGDLMEQISTRGAQILRSTEDNLRSRLSNSIATPAKPPEPVVKK